MTLRFQRLLLILFTLMLLSGSVLLILNNSKKNLIFFYTPSELIKSNLPLNKIVRVGAFVAKNSLNIINANTYEFRITDNDNSVMVFYEGILPDLFKEEQGVVIEGILIKKNYINASSVFAKHDENYMPVSIKKDLKKNNFWQKNYK